MQQALPGQRERVVDLLNEGGGGGRVNGLLTSELRLRTAIISRGPMTGNSRHHSFPANEERLRVFFFLEVAQSSGVVP